MWQLIWSFWLLTVLGLCGGGMSVAAYIALAVLIWFTFHYDGEIQQSNAYDGTSSTASAYDAAPALFAPENAWRTMWVSWSCAAFSEVLAGNSAGIFGNAHFEYRTASQHFSLDKAFAGQTVEDVAAALSLKQTNAAGSAEAGAQELFINLLELRHRWPESVFFAL